MKNATTKRSASEASSPKRRIQFHTTILQAGKTATGIQIPDGVIEKLSSSKRPAVRVTINGYTYRSTVAVMSGKFMVGVNAENREKAKVAGGEEVDVGIELDTEPREVTLPSDFAAALNRHVKARHHFDGLSYSKKKAFVQGIEGAKTAETGSDESIRRSLNSGRPPRKVDLRRMLADLRSVTIGRVVLRNDPSEPCRGHLD